MTIQQLICFLRAAAASAAEPPPGPQLRALERELGSPLFTAGRELTPAGRLLQTRAESILSRLDQMAADVSMEGASDVLRAGSDLFVNGRLPLRAAARFQRELPGVRLQIQEGESGRLLRMLRRGQLDLCLVQEPFSPSGLSSIPIRDPALRPGEEDYFAAAGLSRFFRPWGGDAPLSLEELWGTPLLIPRRYAGALRRACLRRGFSPRIVLESDSPHTALLWAERGLGIAVLPFTLALGAGARLLVRRLDTDVSPLGVRLVRRENALLTDEARTFIGLLQL